MIERMPIGGGGGGEARRNLRESSESKVGSREVRVLKYQSAVWYLPVPLRCQALESRKRVFLGKGFSLVACKDLVFVYLLDLPITPFVFGTL